MNYDHKMEEINLRENVQKCVFSEKNDFVFYCYVLCKKVC